MDDLSLTIPASQRVEAQNAQHLARMVPELRAPAMQFEGRMRLFGWPVAFVQSRRYEPDQLAIWQHGRELRADGWHVVDEHAVQTRAQTVVDTAHGCLCFLDRTRKHAPTDPGCAFAFDWAFLVDGNLVGPRPGPGNDSWDRDLPWRDGALILQDRLGLVSGASFGDHPAGALNGWDAGHAELPGWREKRAAHVARFRAGRT